MSVNQSWDDKLALEVNMMERCRDRRRLRAVAYGSDAVAVDQDVSVPNDPSFFIYRDDDGIGIQSRSHLILRSAIWN